MPEFFSSDGSYLLQFIVIFLVILVLLMGAVLLFRRLAGRGLSVSTRAGTSDRQPRLGIVDIYELDRQRQLILLRRDNVEHLLLVGGPNDVVVERNVQRAARLPSEGLLLPDIAEDEPAPPAVGLDEEPGPPVAAARPAPAPSFEMPVVVPLPGSRGATAIQAPSLDPRLFEPDDAETEAPAPSRPRATRLLRRTPPPLVEPRPEPASERPAGTVPVTASGEPRPVDPAVLSDMAQQLEVALRRPSSAVTPAPGRAGAPAPAAKPGESSPRVADPVAAGMAAVQVFNPAAPATAPEAAQAPVEPSAAAEPPPPSRPADRPVTGPDREAETAGAPPTTPPSPEAATVPDAPKPEPVAAARDEGRADPPAPLFEDTAARDSTDAGAAEWTPAKRKAAESKPAEPKPAVPEPAEPKPADPKPEPAAAAFSVEEIEAEFARLLGRPVDTKKL